MPASNLPTYGRVQRHLAPGMHPLRALLPEALLSPALERISPDAARRAALVHETRVLITEERGYAWVDETVPCIVLTHEYYRTGDERDLYLDLLHELTHVRQHEDGLDIWDESRPYVNRPTEIEGYAVAVAEGRRLGMSEAEVVEHLTNPWMSDVEVRELLASIDALLDRPAP